MCSLWVGPSSFEWLKLQSCIGVKQHDQKAPTLQSSQMLWGDRLLRPPGTLVSPWFSFVPVSVDCGGFPCTSVPPTHTLRGWVWQKGTKLLWLPIRRKESLLPTYIPSAWVPECSFMETFLPSEKWRSYKCSFDCSHLILRLGLASAQAEKSQGTWFLKLAVTQITHKIFR